MLIIVKILPGVKDIYLQWYLMNLVCLGYGQGPTWLLEDTTSRSLDILSPEILVSLQSQHKSLLKSLGVFHSHYLPSVQITKSHMGKTKKKLPGYSCHVIEFFPRETQFLSSFKTFCIHEHTEDLSNIGRSAIYSQLCLLKPDLYS